MICRNIFKIELFLLGAPVMLFLGVFAVGLGGTALMVSIALFAEGLLNPGNMSDWHFTFAAAMFVGALVCASGAMALYKLLKLSTIYLWEGREKIAGRGGEYLLGLLFAAIPAVPLLGVAYEEYLVGDPNGWLNFVVLPVIVALSILCTHLALAIYIAGSKAPDELA